MGLAAFMVIGVSTGLAQAPTPPPLVRTPEPVHSLRSHSGQFIVSLAQASTSSRPLNLVTNKTLVVLEPTFLTVSCERIKQAFSRVLGANAPWEGKIYVALFPAMTDNDPIGITCERLRDGWRYRLDLPDRIAAPHFLRVLVQVLLLEMANRS